MKRFVLRWFAVFLVTVLVAMFVVSHVSFMSMLRQMEAEPGRAYRGMVALLQEALDGKTLEEARASLISFSNRSGADAELFAMDDSRLSADVREDLVREKLSVRRGKDRGIRGLVVYVTVPIEGRDWAAVMGPFTKPMGPDLKAYLAMGILVLLILAVSTASVSVPLFNRLRKLERTARQIADGDLGARVPISESDGLTGFVAQQFNTMAMRIEQLMASQKMMLQAVAHELRTPSARIRFGLEMLESAGDRTDRDKRIQAIDDDLSELDDLVEELLIFNKMEALGDGINTAATPVLPSLKKLIEKRGFLRPGVEVGLDVPDPGVMVKADPRAFLRATGNLLSNALRFTRTRVVLQVAREGDMIAVSVCDDGPGIPVSERQSIFEPFKRLDDSRNRESGGAGLGLAIVSSIVSAHAGRIEVGESFLGGARFTVWWPSC
ncbi:MAG TPA: ATP-binding protein [Myxococcota bacterium]|nr:ATP-binding protein [Myxococcota bacterium]HQP94865.1 ATP-binding protein [Myxococcota bacterium]